MKPRIGVRGISRSLFGIWCWHYPFDNRSLSHDLNDICVMFRMCKKNLKKEGRPGTC